MRTGEARPGGGGKAGFGRPDLRALAGSALLWSWVDALYMSSFFAPFGQRGLMPELATWSTFLMVVPISVVLLRRGLARRLVSTPRALAVAGALGSAASLLFALAAALGSAGLVVACAVPAAAFMASSVLAWGVVYCEAGARSALVYVAGGFACALAPDLTFMFMAPPVGAIAPATLPLASNLLLTTQDLPAKLAAMERGVAEAAGMASAGARAHAAGSARGVIGGLVRRNLGISFGTVASMALIMFGLGYMQHQISFTTMLGAGGVTMDVVRCASSALLLLIALRGESRARYAYSVGLLAIVAGFSLMPFLHATGWFWVCGAVNIAGYATFDVLIWVIVAQAAYTGLSDPLRLICVMRLLVSSAFTAMGGFLSMGLALLQMTGPFTYADAVFMGYLMTVAIVLILANRDVWDLLAARRPQPGDSGAQGGRSSLESAVDLLAGCWGLTGREREVFALLALGRTQPWVAERLGISESTVNSHVRHIYAKAQVNGRQELLDLVAEAQSPESIDIADQRR
ncbi:MAG: helix-turn-helix transcriptional regulator [Coriobacteriales bacterium]|jgi:DNA-binding CsgD family transcriptional regulator